LFFSFAFGQAAGGEAAKPVGPKLWIDSKTIDLGVIAVDQQQIEGVVRYMNEGDETLEITNINGPCDCFAGLGRILFFAYGCKRNDSTWQQSRVFNCRNGYTL
jgi:hypothetical protein